MTDEVEPEQGGESPKEEMASRRRDNVVDKSHSNLIPIVSVLTTGIVGLAGVGGTVLASKLSVDASIRNQDSQLKEQRSKEDRDRKAQTYAEFLEAANGYSSDVLSSRRCIFAVRDSQPPGAKTYSLESCIPTLNELRASRSDFQGARSKVYMYGSQVAEDQARKMASYLPSARGVDAVEGFPPLQDDFVEFDYSIFDGMYQEFNSIVCREIPAEPRSNCD